MADNRWTQASLTDVVETWIVGSTPSRADPSRFALKGGAPWAKVEDVTGGVLYETAERLSKRGESGMQRIPEGAVLVTTAGTIGRTAIAGREMFCNQAVQALSFRRDVILPQFGYYFLRSQRPLLQHLANSTTIRRIPKGELQRVQLRYPSLSVQERMIEQVRGPELLAEKAGQFQQLLEKFLLAVTAQAARYTKNHLPIGDLLEEDPLAGLRAKPSPTGNGIPLVNKLGGGGRLARLESYPRVQVQTRQISRYSLRPMDLLLRGSTLGADPRGILVGDLPEEALVGGDLVRLRLRPSVSPAWLLAWLRGPGGDRLYENGRLQKPLLRKYRVPIPEEQAELGQNLLLYWALEEKAAQFSQWAQTLFDVVLRRVFSKSSVEIAFGEQPEDRLDRYLAQLSQPMSQFLQEMSQFQQELYHSLLLSEKNTPIHVLFRQMEKGPHPSAGIQDARSAAALLTQFGLLEQGKFQEIPFSPEPEEEQTYLADHNGRPIWVETYQPTRDIFEENAYAAGADQDTEL